MDTTFQSLEEAAELFAKEESDLKESDTELLKRFARLKKEVKADTAALKAKKADLTKLTIEALAVMDAAGIQKISVEDRTLAPSSRTWFYVIAAKRDESHRWLKANGFEALVVEKEVVNTTSLSAQLKEFEDMGHSVPSELFNKEIKRDLGMTK